MPLQMCSSYSSIQAHPSRYMTPSPSPSPSLLSPILNVFGLPLYSVSIHTIQPTQEIYNGEATHLIMDPRTVNTQSCLFRTRINQEETAWDQSRIVSSNQKTIPPHPSRFCYFSCSSRPLPKPHPSQLLPSFLQTPPQAPPILAASSDPSPPPQS